MRELLISYFRIPALIASSLTVPLVIALGRELFGKAAGLLGGLIFAILPATVLLGRLNKEDNLLTLFAVAAVLCSFKYVRTHSRRYYIFMLVTVFLSIVCKEVGAFVACSCAIVCARADMWRAVWGTAVASVLAIACYFIYGLLNWTEFLNAVTTHAGYATHVTGALPTFTTFQIQDFHADGWLIWLWIAALLGAGHNRRSLIAPVSYVIIFSILAVGIFDAPWYRIPLLPFLCVPAGYALLQFIKNPDAIKAALFMFTAGISTAQIALFDIPEQVLGTYGTRTVLLTLAVLTLLAEFPLRWHGFIVRRSVAIISVLLFIGGNILIVFFLDQTYTSYLGGMPR